MIRKSSSQNPPDGGRHVPSERLVRNIRWATRTQYRRKKKSALSSTGCVAKPALPDSVGERGSWRACTTAGRRSSSNRQAASHKRYGAIRRLEGEDQTRDNPTPSIDPLQIRRLELNPT